MTDLAALRSLAMKATPGPWDTVANRNLPRAVIRAGSMQIADAFNDTHWTDEQCVRNAAFIAAANPAAILSILDGMTYWDRGELFCLAHNLAIGAGLCESFELGRGHAHGLLLWKPGCGRSAP